MKGLSYLDRKDEDSDFRQSDSERAEIMEKRSIGREVKILSNLVKREISAGRIFEGESGGTTGVQGMIIGYLYHNRDREIFQRDIEQEFKIRRSTVTGILQLMEKEGLISRQSVERDGRLKHLILTDKAVEVHQHIKERLDAVDEKIIQGISPQELEQFYMLLDRMKHNLEQKEL